jgi:basic membrane protein A and related proteins
MKNRKVIPAVLLVGIVSFVAACSSSTPAATESAAPAPAASEAAPAASSAAPAATEAPAEPLNVTWTYTGPENDGGYNVINAVAMNAMTAVPGVSVNGVFDVPYSDEASQIIRQAIAGGAKVIVDTVGLGALLTDVCAENLDKVYCYSGADAGPQPANSASWWLPDWDLSYAAGVAAGSMTKSNIIGAVVPYEIPIAVQGVNAYALGCQSVKPECEVKVVYMNSYFDPTAATKAAKTLVNAGADVLRNLTDDASFCKVAEEEGVYAVGEYNDFSSACPNSIITSTVWDFSDYMIEEAKQIQAGEFTSTGDSGFPEITPLKNGPGGPHLGTFGAFVPADVKAKVEGVFAEMVAGKNFFVGPIYDQKGTEKVPAGTELEDKFLFHDWDWYVKGVTASEG